MAVLKKWRFCEKVVTYMTLCIDIGAMVFLREEEGERRKEVKNCWKK
jgi:hypothetical protein